jgi:uncharacterized membrane protein
MTASISSRTHNERSQRSLRDSLAVIGRAVAVSTMVAGCFAIAWAFAQSFMSFAISATPAFSTGVAFGSILALGMFCTSQLKQLGTLTRGALDWINDAEPKPGKHLTRGAGHLALESFLIAFPVCLAILTFHRATADEPEPAQPPGRVETETQYIHALHYRHPEERLAVYLPYLVFRPGSLVDPDVPYFDPDSTPGAEIFAEASYSISRKQADRLEDYIDHLVIECRATDINPVSITIFGFASDAPFLDGERQPRGDSKILNRHLANLRARFVERRILDSISGNNALRSAIKLSAPTWDTFSEMAQFRDRHAFKSFQFALSEYTDHRSAMLFIDDPSRCPSIVHGIGDQNLQASAN